MTEDPEDDARDDHGAPAGDGADGGDAAGERTSGVDADDPFDRLEADADREGDPFDHLPGPDERDVGGPDANSPDREGDVLRPSDVVDPADLSDEGDRANGGPPAGGGGHSDDAGEESGVSGAGGESEADGETVGDPSQAPTTDLSDEGGAAVDAGPAVGPVDDGLADDPFADVATPEGDPFDGDAGGVFERVDVDRVDPDRVWDEVAGEDAIEDAAGDEAAGEEPPELTDASSRYAEVSKHAYCEQCEHFSAPPNVSCGNPGTEIVEFVDVETVRLLNCPVVAERRELEDET